MIIHIHTHIYVNNIVRFVYKRYFEIGKIKEGKISTTKSYPPRVENSRAAAYKRNEWKGLKGKISKTKKTNVESALGLTKAPINLIIVAFARAVVVVIIIIDIVIVINITKVKRKAHRKKSVSIHVNKRFST